MFVFSFTVQQLEILHAKTFNDKGKTITKWTYNDSGYFFFLSLSYYEQMFIKTCQQSTVRNSLPKWSVMSGMHYMRYPVKLSYNNIISMRFNLQTYKFCKTCTTNFKLSFYVLFTSEVPFYWHEVKQQYAFKGKYFFPWTIITNNASVSET